MGNSTSHPSHLKFILINQKATATRLLQDAEDIDGYLDVCEQDRMNQLSRKRTIYAANSISPEDYLHYHSVLEQAIPHIPPRLRMDLKDISIVPLMPSADGGMPHTRPHSIIAVPQLQHLTDTGTIIHELWHIHQRTYKDSWTRIFALLGWTEWTGRLPAFLEVNRRINPDTMDAPLWAYQNTWVPVPVFRDVSQPNVSEVDIWFYHINDEYHLKKIPRVMVEYHPGLPQVAYEHPREIGAYLLSDPKKYPDSPVLRDMIGAVGKLSLPVE